MQHGWCCKDYDCIVYQKVKKPVKVVVGIVFGINNSTWNSMGILKTGLPYDYKFKLSNNFIAGLSFHHDFFKECGVSAGIRVKSRRYGNIPINLQLNGGVYF